MGEKSDSKETGGTEALHRAYHAESPEDTARIYDDWAGDYETHMQNSGYTHPAVVASMVARHVPPTAERVLDAGAGTGVLGEILRALGYTNLYGLDASPGMLEIAASRQNYQALSHQFLGHTLDYENDSFALVASSGVFTQGHAPLDGLDELLRITRRGGHLVFSIARTYLDGGFAEKRAQLDAAGAWRFVAASERYNSAPLKDELIAQVYVFEVL